MNFACHASSVMFVQLLEPIPGMDCPLASGLGTNIFSAYLLLAQVFAQFKFCNQAADLEVIM